LIFWVELAVGTSNETATPVGHSTCSTVAAREEVFRASLENLGTRHEEPEGIGQPTDHIERETDRERILDLLARSAGSEDCSHVIRIPV